MAITEIDSLEFDTTICIEPHVTLLDSTHLIIAYQGPDEDAFIKTFSFDGSYDTLTEIDSLEHDSDATYSVGEEGSLITIDSTHVMLAYLGFETGSFATQLIIKTFTIDGSYNITETDKYIPSNVYPKGYDNSLVMLDSTHFILAFRGVNDDGFIMTMSIDGSYTISGIDFLEHDIYSGYSNSMVKIDSSHVALAYLGAGSDGQIKTFSVDGSCDNITEIDDLEIVEGAYGSGSLQLVDSTHLILAFSMTGANEQSNDAFIKTFSFDGSYDTLTEIDSLEHDTDNHQHQSLVQLNATNYALAYDDFGLYDGYIKTFSLDGSYDITENENMTYDTSTIGHIQLVAIDSTHACLVYRGDGNDGFLKTFSLALASTDYDAYLFHGISDLTNFNGMLHASGITNINGVT